MVGLMLGEPLMNNAELSEWRNNQTKVLAKVENDVEWININFGEVLIFNQSLPHGNVVNEENETRWSMNCRFKSLFSPYGDKRVGEFFLPITTRATTLIGQNFKYPFKFKLRTQELSI